MTHSQNPAEEQNELAMRSTVHWLRHSWAVDYPACAAVNDFTLAMSETADEVERVQAEIHRLRDELAAYRELAHRAVVASHMRQHGGINRPLFDDCREGFCGDWHALEKT